MGFGETDPGRPEDPSDQEERDPSREDRREIGLESDW